MKSIFTRLPLSGLLILWWLAPLHLAAQDGSGDIDEDLPNRLVIEKDWVRWQPGLASIDTVRKLVIEEADDFTPELLKPFTQLTGLMIKDTPVQDLTFLKNHTGLTVFECQGNYLKSLNGIEACTQLKELAVMHNFLRDVNALRGLSQLTMLNLYDNDITSIEPLRNLRAIEHLDVGNNPIGSIEPIRGFTQLKVLSVYQDTLLTDVSLIRDFTNLTNLNLSLLRIPDFSLSIVSDMKGMKNLRIQGMVADNEALNHIKHLTQIEQLTMGLNDGVTSLDSLWRLKGLKYLDIHSDNVTNLNVLKGMNLLVKLVMYRNKVSDLSPLTACPELRSLFIFENPIKDYSPLLGHRQLQYLQLSAKDVDAQQQLMLRHRLPATRITYY